MPDTLFTLSLCGFNLERDSIDLKGMVEMVKKDRKKRHGKMLSLLLIPLLSLNMGSISAPEVHAAETNGKFIYVAENGNDFSGNGSSGSPYRSIKKAAVQIFRPGRLSHF